MAALRERAEYLDVMEEMKYFSERPMTPISHAVFHPFAPHLTHKTALLQGALFLKAELPIRLAHSAHLLDRLPRALGGLAAFQQVREMFTDSFRDLRSFQFSKPAPVWEDSQRFHDMLFVLQNRHKHVPEVIFQGCKQLRAQLHRTHGPNWADHPDQHLTQDVLDEFFGGRAVVRFLVGQQLQLHAQYIGGESPSDVFGLVQLKVDSEHLMKASIATCKRMAIASFGVCPDIELTCNCGTPLVQIGHHIQFITIRLLRHAIIGVLQAHGVEKVKEGNAVPPITVTVADAGTNEDLCIRVQDSSLGISRSKLRQLWSYLHDDAHLGEQEWVAATEEDKQYGEGFGLPLARLRAWLFGGDVVVQSVQGVGLDMYAYIPKFKPEEVLSGPAFQK
eukprot:GGOE01000359.1.p1 GENE.GGOE01000359.1~~GGOE01000359.1.p1  ORF type:complete len:455 (-),score=137.29 GGOE01000359.1:151-1323(-)